MAEFFDGNDDEYSIAPNQADEGRPHLSEIYERFKALENDENIAWIRVFLHDDTEITENDDGEELAVFVIQFLGEGLMIQSAIEYSIPAYILIVIAEIVSLILSITGVVTASRKHLKLRALGVAGIVISGVFLQIVVAVFLMFTLGFRESPPVATESAGG